MFDLQAKINLSLAQMRVGLFSVQCLFLSVYVFLVTKSRTMDWK